MLYFLESLRLVDRRLSEEKAEGYSEKLLVTLRGLSLYCQAEGYMGRRLA
jgi:hypothetical protein